MEETADIFQESLLNTSTTTSLVNLWFWSLFLGSVIINASSQNGEGNWFADQLAQINRHTEFSSWEFVESKLQTVCYSSSKMRGLGQVFWQKVHVQSDYISTSRISLFSFSIDNRNSIIYTKLNHHFQ
jgi:hypothetical protein